MFIIVFCAVQEDSQKIKALEKDLKEARSKPAAGGAEDVSWDHFTKTFTLQDIHF